MVAPPRRPSPSAGSRRTFCKRDGDHEHHASAAGASSRSRSRRRPATIVTFDIETTVAPMPTCSTATTWDDHGRPGVETACRYGPRARQAPHRQADGHVRHGEVVMPSLTPEEPLAAFVGERSERNVDAGPAAGWSPPAAGRHADVVVAEGDDVVPSSTPSTVSHAGATGRHAWTARRRVDGPRGRHWRGGRRCDARLWQSPGAAAVPAKRCRGPWP